MPFFNCKTVRFGRICSFGVKTVGKNSPRKGGITLRIANDRRGQIPKFTYNLGNEIAKFNINFGITIAKFAYNLAIISKKFVSLQREMKNIECKK